MPSEIVPLAFFAMIVAVTVGTPIVRALARRIDRSEAAPAALPADTTARLERMEQAIDAIAVEVERIAEGQRFTTRLLADRAGGAGMPANASPGMPANVPTNAMSPGLLSATGAPDR